MNKITLVALTICIFLSGSAYAKRIGILSALPQEQQDLISKVSNGKIGKHEVFLSLSGIGKVNAAASAQKLISEDKVDVIIFTGVAGGINPEYNIGDVVLVKKTFQHDVGFLGDTFVLHPPGVLPEVGIGTNTDPLYFDLRQFLNKQDLNSIDKLSHKFSKQFQKVIVDGSSYQPKMYINGTVATGDQFIANDEKKESLRSLGADVAEMEGAAVVQIAHQNKIPCLIIRSVSDKAGKKASVNFKDLFATVATNNSNLVEYILQNVGF